MAIRLQATNSIIEQDRTGADFRSLVQGPDFTYPEGAGLAGFSMTLFTPVNNGSSLASERLWST